jgi:hypothetical protein
MAQQSIKVIGNNGQLSLGKEFAGKTVLIEQVDPGTWVIKAGVFIPDSEKWLYKNGNLEKLERALKWAETHPPVDNFAEVMEKLEKKIYEQDKD